MTDTTGAKPARRPYVKHVLRPRPQPAAAPYLTPDLTHQPASEFGDRPMQVTSTET